MAGNVHPLAKAREQAQRLRKLVRRDELVDISVLVFFDDDEFRVQRAWRVLFGLYQDCACIQWSKGFKKRKGRGFRGKMWASRLPLFVREAMDYVAEERARIEVNGRKLPPRLLEVMEA